MTSTQIKKLNAYPEWNSLPAYIQVMNYIQSINEDEAAFGESLPARSETCFCKFLN